MMHVAVSELDLYKPLEKQESAMDQDKLNQQGSIQMIKKNHKSWLQTK